MKNQCEFRPVIKGVLFWVVFMLMYALQKILPYIPVTLFVAVDESNFQHFKASFFAYLFLSVIEFLIFRKRIVNKKSYCFARLTATIFTPWIVFLTWYVIPAVYGRLPGNVLEIVYGNIITLIVGILAVILERGFEQIVYNKPLIVTLLGLFAISIMLYIVLTFNLPWIDVFKEADWKESTNLLWRIYV